MAKTSDNAGQSWTPVLALSAIALLVQGSTLFSLTVLIPHAERHFSGPAGFAASAFLVAMSLSNIIVGHMLDRIGVRAMLCAGVFLVGAGWMAAAMAADRIILSGAMAVAGAGVAASTLVPAITIVTRLMADRRGIALGALLCATLVGGAVLPPALSLLLDRLGWQGAMSAWSAGLLLACIPFLPCLPRLPRSSRPVRARALTPRLPLAAAGFIGILAAMILLQLSINGILFAAVSSLLDQGFTATRATAAYGLANLMGLPALLLGGLATDRIGARRALIGSSLLLALGSASLLLARPWGIAGLGAFVILWGGASALPGQSAPILLDDRFAPDAFPGLLGTIIALTGLLGSIAPAMTDGMRALSGGYGLPVLTYAAMAFVAAVVIAMVRPARSSDMKG
ncbi:putative MFS family arabinose efflux permease [Sphingobium sp. OAS761]|uniref:MFS transporter n=1 Tax=Sphingobium sp. OAS761 TaxID=2817901 RepID=UPI0020A0B98F|nr:MFS transporter [Sphingobium sp. OAS761]MCP1470589.1 putative MFS family arabinose efflux permease [Sphingobium sp. OAS761]